MSPKAVTGTSAVECTGESSSEARSWSKTPPCADSRTWQQCLLPGSGGSYLLGEELTSDGLIGYQGVKPLTSIVKSSDLKLEIISRCPGRVCRKISWVSRVQVKQALVKRGMYSQ